MTQATRPRSAVAAALVVVLVLGVVSLWGRTGERVAPDPIGLTVTAADARAVMAEFIALLNGGDVDAAFAKIADAVRSRPEAIDGLDVNPFLDFAQELEHARWIAELGAERAIHRCSAQRWTHLVDGIRRADDAQLLTCEGQLSTSFLGAIGLGSVPIELTVAVDAGLEIVLYKEYVLGGVDTMVHLDFRRWLRAHHPDDELDVFTPGGTPLATPRSAQLMLHHAAAFGSYRGEL